MIKTIALVTDASGMDLNERFYAFKDNSNDGDYIDRICAEEFGDRENHDVQYLEEANVYLIDSDAIAIKLIDVEEIEVL